MMADIADLAPEWPLDFFASSLQRVLGKWNVEAFRSALSHWQKDEQIIGCHLPWVAFAVECQLERTRSPKPSEYRAQFVTARQSALELLEHIRRLENMTFTPESQIKQLGFLSAAQAMIQNFGGQTEILSLKLRLSDLAEATFFATDFLDANAKALSGGAGSRIPGTESFVSILAAVWAGLTGKKATAENKRTGGPSDFVIFVQAVAEIAKKEIPEMPIPSPGHVRTCLP
ncbi:hypothetical protein BH10PSE12_BH10PSE12_18950 [soil metagenome]